MKVRLLLALVGLAISFAVPSFTQEKDTVDPKIAEQVRALATKYDEACNKNDAVAVAAFLTDNAIWITPHGTLSGSRLLLALAGFAIGIASATFAQQKHRERIWRHTVVETEPTRCI